MSERYVKYEDRSYKFRVWDDHYKQYVHSLFCLHHAGMLYVPYTQTPTLERDTLTIERCTGLLDSKGHDVMVGDILDDGGNLFQVIWHQPIASFRLQEYPESNGDTERCVEACVSRMTIVGNIHGGVKRRTTI